MFLQCETSQSASDHVTSLLTIPDGQLIATFKDINESFRIKKQSNIRDGKIDTENNLLPSNSDAHDGNEHSTNHGQLDRTLKSVCS